MNESLVPQEKVEEKVMSLSIDMRENDQLEIFQNKVFKSVDLESLLFTLKSKNVAV